MVIIDSTAVSSRFRRGARFAPLLAFAALLVTSSAPAAQQPAKQLTPAEAARACVALKCRQLECPTVRCNLTPYNECVKRCKNGG